MLMNLVACKTGIRIQKNRLKSRFKLRIKPQMAISKFNQGRKISSFQSSWSCTLKTWAMMYKMEELQGTRFRSFSKTRKKI